MSISDWSDGDLLCDDGQADPRDLAEEVVRLRAPLSLAREALEGVIRVADRQTDEFDAARAALAAISKVLG